jgi:hypothetical protein
MIASRFKKWVFSGGKVALLGDAAHAMLPHQGKIQYLLQYEQMAGEIHKLTFSTPL